MAVVKATVNGAISIVNAIATGKGATLGTSLKVEAVIENTPGTVIIFGSDFRIIEVASPFRTIASQYWDFFARFHA